jgi:hypothetical protein
MLSVNARLSEQVKFVTGLPPAVPNSSTPDYVSMKGFERCCIVIMVKNATTVTGSDITVKQAKTVAGGSEKALAFSKAWRSIDVDAANGDVLAEFAVTSDTFTTDGTNSKNLLYVIEVDSANMDKENGFDCLRAGTGNAAAATLAVLYALYPRKYHTDTTAIVD